MRPFVAIAIIGAAAAAAHGHGRPPMTTGIYFKPGDPHTLHVSTTFGLLISPDDGCTVYWVCEAKVGYGADFDPKFAIAADGAIFATTFRGLRISRDGGCSFQTATAQLPAADPNRIADIWVDALAIASNGNVWAGTAETGRTNDVFLSTDNGMTFAPRGLASTTITWKHVAVAPSDPARVFAVGLELNPPAIHLRRLDGGTWTPLPLTGVQIGVHPDVPIAAIDPVNPDVVYLVSSDANTPTGDRLYRSSDNGMTFAEVLATSGPIHDVVIRGSSVYVTSLMLEGQVFVGGPAFASSNGGMSFAPFAGAPNLQCLANSPDGSLAGCAANWKPEFMAITRSLDGSAWDKVWRFVELEGPLACAPETDLECEQSWTTLQRDFGTSGPACGAHAVDAGLDVEDSRQPASCIDCQSGNPSTLALCAAILWPLVRRRNPRSCSR